MIKLRDYQEEAVNICLDFLKKKNPKPTVIVHPTGAGKSIVIGNLVSKIKEPVLILQPSKELLEQNFAKLKLYGGEASIYSASMDSKEIGHVTYATLGSIKKLGKKFKEFGVKTVLVDEVHEGYAPEDGSMFKNFIKDLDPLHIIGFTATPIRLKQYGDMTSKWSQLNMINRTIPKIFSSISQVVQIGYLVENKYWADLSYEEWDFDESILKLNSTGAEFTEQSIKKSIADQNINNNIYIRLKKLLNEGKSALVFIDSVNNAEKMADKLGELAFCISSKTKKKDRDKAINDFKSGKLKIITNYGTLAKGFDYPELNTVIIGRPTNSLAVFYQQAGRVVRNPEFPNQKKALIIDFCNNVKRFGRLETLNFRNVERYGWGMFTETNLLTGIPMGTKVTLEELERKSKRQKEDLIDYTLTFGKFKDKKLSETPLGYRNWLLANVDDMPIKDISTQQFKDQLLLLLDTAPKVPNDIDKLIIVDFNNITYKLYSNRRLNKNGFAKFLEELKEKFQTTNLSVVTDSKRDKYWRKEIFPEYKDNRKKQEFDEKFVNGLNEIYKNFDIKYVEGLEADDIIADEVRSNKYKEVYVISSDSDFGQLAIFNRFNQFDMTKFKKLEYSKKQAIEILVTKILKGDPKDNVYKSHNEGRILTKDLNVISDLIYKDILAYVKINGIKNIEEVNLYDIFYNNLSRKFNMDKNKFDLNFKLLNLIQKQY